MKIALVYDRINKWGGAERVLLTLHELFPDAPLYTSVYNPGRAPWASVFKVKPSFLQKFPYASFSHELYPGFMPLAFESFSFDEYDLVISITSEAAKGIITRSKTFHLCYCLTPTRYLWSGYNEYFKNKTLKFLAKPAISYLKKWDKIASQRPDAYLAISKEVQRRIKTYYGKSSVVVYPPLNLDRSNFKNQNKKQMKNGEYFLVVSRLVPYKRIDIAIEACNELKLPLKIIGTGSEEKRLKKIAGPTIKFLGNLTDDQLLGYYSACKALIFPGNEDFGLTVLETQSLGKPVIAFRGGGSLETIIEGKTGEFFYPQNKKALIYSLKKFTNLRFNSADCILQAEKYNKEKFKKEFMAAVIKSMEVNKK